MRNRKGAMQISIVLLVIATLILVITSIYFFNIREKNLTKSIVSGSDSEKVYVKQEIVDFYLRRITSRTNTNGNVVMNFQNELYRYKDRNGNYPIIYLKQVESQLDSIHIRLEGGKLKVDFDINIPDAGYSEDRLLYLIKYDHHFSYEK